MRTFLSILILSFAFVHITQAQGPKRPDLQPAPETTEIFNLGIAGYTFHKFDLDKTLETLQKTDVHYLCIKDFHLPFNSTDKEIKAFHAILADYSVTGFGVGPIYMRSKEEVDN
ncbi:MAG: sugar phosphate isomerase/epimerase, partial [Dysgonamonadaceae bacterium]|nr:sugar phosphate isomerase/epimerase [Dysgonamonadaceae bacterium]